MAPRKCLKGAFADFGFSDVTLVIVYELLAITKTICIASITGNLAITEKVLT
ncbi:hypothetical protein EV424DRAFT_1536151 [Suillus variegatus]|nr:hypothetical protein EV424DRAFT_1536151 [Suillus variegatus]